MRVDLQTQSRKHFGRTTYDLNGQIKDNQSVFESFQTSPAKGIDAALVNFRGISSRANLKKMPFVSLCFLGHELSKNVDKLLQILGIFWGTASRQPERHLPNEDLH